MNIPKAIFILLLASIITFGFKKIYEPPKTYTVTKTLPEWEASIRYLENAKYIMQRADLPSNQVVAWSDSISRLEQSIQMQVSQQIAADTVKPKTK